ncbi:hypothetical protein [Enterobacter phage vB_EclS_AS5]
MKFQIFKAIDKLDGKLSLFMFDEENNYTVVWYEDENIAKLVKAARKRGCDWSDIPGKKSRRDYMIDPVLLCEIEA